MEELESFQVIIAPTSTFSSMTVRLSNFTRLGAAQWVDVGAAKFSQVSAWGQGTYQVTDATTQVAPGGTVALSSTIPTVLWITVYIPGTGTQAGNSSATLILTPNGHSSITIPVNLYVFNFKLPRTPNFATYLDGLPLIETYDFPDMDAWKLVYLQHRMSLPASDWPNGLTYGVAWDCDSQSLTDATSPPSTESCIWANGCTMRRYIQGKGGMWRGEEYDDWIPNGFPIYQAVATDWGRPDPFCGVPCNDPTHGGWMCQTTYEQKWGAYLAALQSYFIAQNVSTTKVKGFWYTQNEPQNYNDYTISAYLCSVARKYAPKLTIMLSREAQAQIAERREYNNCSYDIWMAHVWRYTPTYTRMRQANYGEVSWFYSLDSDLNCAYPGVCNGAFSPAVSNTGNNGAEDPLALNDGPHYRVIPWVAWSNRVTGWGYYDSGIFWDNSPPAPAPARARISASLLREGFEDYEYLFKANGNKAARVNVKETSDDTAMSIGYAVGIWERDPTTIHTLRHELGRKIEGTRADFPYTVKTPTRTFSNYYIDFQDTSAGPVADFNFGGHTWKAIGWEPYNITKGYGWNSQVMGVPNTIQTGNPILRCIDAGSGNVVQSTICYDDYNHQDEFHFALPQGIYNVTVGIGWPGACRGDTEFVSINNVVLRNQTCSPCCQDVREYWGKVHVYPGASGAGIVMTFGNDQGYTILSYMKIETSS
eukprot:Phypoly_transcript_00453.p2 GENE.Phypoly_transcript_00453~~Phypoly_transcript_00453.p2  ORF type:complete len:706 (+),score=95.46 Phypoly_transcript_00453:2560-4677(+)